MKKAALIFALILGLFVGSASADDLPWIRYYATDANGVTTELFTGTRIPMGDYRLWAITSAGSLICVFVDTTGTQNEITVHQLVPTFQIWPVLGESVHLFVGSYRIESLLWSGPGFSGLFVLHPVRADFDVTKF
jgi:hypothetical protein